MYTWWIHLMPTKGVLKKGGKHKIQLHSSYIKLSQSTKSILDKEWSSMYINDLLLFFLLQCPKQSQRGHLQDFFFFFPSIFLHESAMPTQKIFSYCGMHHPNNTKKRETGCHRILTLGQWRSRWSIDSSSFLHM